MAKRTFFLIFFILVLIISGILIYFYYEKPHKLKNLQSFVNVTISAQEENKYVKTGYKIIVNNVEYKKGETLSSGILLEKVPTNSSIIIYNTNIDNQTYYSDFKNFTTTEIKNYRVNLELVKPGVVQVTHFGKIGVDDVINVKLNGTNFNNVKACVSWSSHIIFVNILNYTKIDKLSEYKNYDKCYDLGFSLHNTEKQLNLEYKTFGNLNSADEIKLVFIDSIYTNLGYVTILDDKDVGAPNLEYEIKY